MGAACVNRAGKILSLHILRSAAYVAIAQTETLLFLFIGQCHVTHHQKERQWKGTDVTMSDLHCTWCSYCSWWKNFANYWLNYQHLKVMYK